MPADKLRNLARLGETFATPATRGHFAHALRLLEMGDADMAARILAPLRPKVAGLLAAFDAAGLGAAPAAPAVMR
jgi:hypothetical protein